MYSFGVQSWHSIPRGAPRRPRRLPRSAPGKELFMPRSATSRAALLLVVVLIAVPALQAAPTRAEADPALSVPAAWDLFTQAWDFLTGVWSTNGCGLDPSGSCQPRPTTIDSDNGCGLDPSGGCGN